jgi:hypothetical protein
MHSGFRMSRRQANGGVAVIDNEPLDPSSIRGEASANTIAVDCP